MPHNTQQRSSAISPVRPLAPCIWKALRLPARARIPCQRESRRQRCSRLVGQSHSSNNGPGAGSFPDTPVSDGGKVRRIFAAKTKQRQSGSSNHDVPLLRDGESTSRFCKCRASIRLRSAAGSGAGEETENATAVWGLPGVSILIGRGLVPLPRGAFRPLMLAVIDHATTCGYDLHKRSVFTGV
jgi:hypothetical protein